MRSDLGAIAAARVAVRAHRGARRRFSTAVSSSELTGSHVVLKAENLQRTGSFKIRGASAKLASLGDGATPGIVVGLGRQPRPGRRPRGAHGRASPARCTCRRRPRSPRRRRRSATAPRCTSRATRSTTASCWPRRGPARPVFTSSTPSTTRRSWRGRARSAWSSSRRSTTSRWSIVPLGGGGLVSGIGCAIDALAPQSAWSPCRPRCAPLSSPRTRRTEPPRSQRASTLADGIAVKRPSGITLGLIERHVDEIVGRRRERDRRRDGHAADALQARRRRARAPSARPR